MRPISWLHISDIHMEIRDKWSQDVVLTAMCDQIKQQRAKGAAADFILVTGDLAFSGKAREYEMVREFFDELCTASGVPKEHIFCIPGNHDIDRDRQTLCFLGARASLQDQSRVDSVLDAGENLETLLKRQEHYRRFQKEYFDGQDRTWTEDGLGYVSRLKIEGVRLAIVGLDSAWLAEGGINDHGKLLIGERQVINALKLVQEEKNPPHIITAMAHHPFHLLQEFDRRPAMSRIERACHFLHWGHLHEPEARTSGPGETGCLTLGAGASFETRLSRNSFSIITLDLLQAVRTVTTLQYNPTVGAFSFASTEKYRIEVTPANICNVTELASAMKAYDQGLAPWVHYLSALLLNRKADLAIPAQNGHMFATFDVLQELPDSDLKRKTADFITFRNVLRMLYGDMTLSEILGQHGATVTGYGAMLRELCKADETLKDRLDAQENDSRLLAETTPVTSFSHTSALLTDLAVEQEWGLLREQAQRHMDSSLDPAMVFLAKRMLALGLANSDEIADKGAAIELYRSLDEDGFTEFSDTGNLAILLIGTGRVGEARPVVLDGIRKFQGKADYFAEIGQRIVEEMGDKDFRKQIEAAMAERGKSD